ncbi:MAG: transglycosylase domain-containing protein [Anaerorhabdus sp.]|uniref:transglycosylase domain-containing protein n=1 Tax=Anaerorhabdus sp. TaxID=1872524 RepID=UPI002FC59EAF
MKLKTKKTANKTVSTSTKPKNKRKVNTRNVTALVISIIVTCEIIVGCVGLFLLVTMLSDKPAFDLSLYESKESSQIFDQNGELIADVGKQIRSNVTYDEVPTSLIDAFVSIEDSRFFGHNGFDIARFGKAMIENVLAMSFAQGGSTLTMQLTKMTYFMDDDSGVGAAKSVERKVQEIALALEVERNTNKKSLLEMYLNKSNFGGTGNIRGVQKAANYYFDKDVSELNLPESAMLAGIVNAPGRYNPFRYLDYSTNRRNVVLNMMLRHGYITEEEANLAKSIKVEDLLVDPNTRKSDDASSEEYAYQSYIDTVVREVQELTGLDPTSTSMKIYTYMDKDVQATMDSIQAGTYEGVEFADDLMEVGMVSMNNQNGQIIAVGGGRNYGRGGSLLLNHATDQYKQPGSAVKPFLDYAPAFEYLGWSTSHVVTDKPIVYAGTNKVIKNFDGVYRGQVTLEDAVGKSLNTPALQALQDVIQTATREKVVEYLQNLGFSKVTSEKFDVGYGIGGSSYECSVVELAGAHAAMLNGGYYYKPHTVSKIEFSDGREPLEPVYTGTQVISSEAAYQTAYLMSKAPYAPYANYMQMVSAGKDYQVYGKTGTTDWGTDGLVFGIPKGAAKDKWMVIETSEVTNVVWVGYEKGVKDKETYFTGKKSNMNIPGKISRALLSATSDETKPGPIPVPEGLVQIQHILGTWPYANTIEGMDPKFITTGYIKKEFNNLVEPQAANIEQITQFSATGNNDGALTINWGAYPNAEQLQVAPDTMDLSLSGNGYYVEAWGARIFDYTWIFGPIRYKATIRENGNIIKEVTSEGATWTENLGLSPGKHTLNIDGFYAYEWLGTPSNVMNAIVEITIPFDTNSAEGCVASGKYWWTTTNTCSETKPATDNEAGCKELGQHWYGNACHVDPEPTQSPDTTTQAGCEAAKKYWYDNKCNDVPNPNPTN